MRAAFRRSKGQLRLPDRLALVKGTPPQQVGIDRWAASRRTPARIAPDPMIDFALTDAQRDVQRSARAFAEREILPRIHELDSTATYDRAIYEKMGAAGLLGLPIPERYGGRGVGLPVLLRRWAVAAAA